MDPAEMASGGPSKDGIPSLDRPVFTSAIFTDQWLNAKESVIVVIRMCVREPMTMVYILPLRGWPSGLMRKFIEESNF